jgi:hypothetical protein
MSDERAEIVAEKASGLVEAMRACGCKLNNACMQHPLLALVVIREVRISDIGLIDVARFEKTEVIVRSCDTSLGAHGAIILQAPSVSLLSAVAAHSKSDFSVRIRPVAPNKRDAPAKPASGGRDLTAIRAARSLHARSFGFRR